MTAHTDLIARLRRGWTTDCLLAADALEALEQQVAALTNERNDLLILLDNWKTSQGVTEDQLAAAQAREAKLREALEWINSRWADVSTLVLVREALALPTDDTALMERLKEEREKCAKVCDKYKRGILDLVNVQELTRDIRSMT